MRPDCRWCRRSRTPRQLEDLDQVDILQVGARNMQNFPLLQALGQVRKPVLLKRGMSATVTELLQAAEYILAGGNRQVILCERGIRTFETDSRATLDIAAIPVLKKLTHLPVIVDPSHAAGRAELVAPPGAGRRGRRSRRPDGGGARPPGLRPVRRGTGPCPATSLTGWPGRCGSCCPTPAADGGLLLPPADREKRGYTTPCWRVWSALAPGDPGAPAGRPGAVGHLSAAEAGHAAAVLCHRVSVPVDARGDHVELLPEYLFDKGKIRQHRQAVAARLDRLARPLQGSDRDKELAIHAFILENVRYDKLKKPYSHEIIGPLTQGVGGVRGHCQNGEGPSDAVQLPLHRGSQRGGPGAGVKYRHTWNVITVDGQRYHLDATFDNSLQRGTPRYDYFNLDDRHIFRDHETLVLPLPPLHGGQGVLLPPPVLHQAGGRGKPCPPGPCGKSSPILCSTGGAAG